MTRVRWEYAYVGQTQDPSRAHDDDERYQTWLTLPGEEPELLAKRAPGAPDLFNRLGADGWELVGPPTDSNAVFTYKPASDVWHDRAFWVERSHIFKRVVEP